MSGTAAGDRGGRRPRPASVLAVVVGMVVMTVMTVVMGCGRTAPPRADRAVMRGSVTLDGQPLGGAIVTIVSVADPTRTAGALVRVDGTYRCDDAPVGDVVIGLERPSGRPPSSGKPEPLPPVPKRYKAWATSGLKATVVTGADNVVPLELTSGPRQP